MAGLLLSLAFVIFFVQISIQQEDTLQQVQVIFRHGDRTPDDYCQSVLPNDHNTFYPEGFGGLTNLGKRQEYNIGVALRKKYGSWLGDVYTPNILEARSTDVPRTKMSLMLALAGLFPPKGNQIWDQQTNWQPIPYNYEKKNADIMMGWPGNCKNFDLEYEKVYNSATVQNIIASRKKEIDYILWNTQNEPTITSRPIAKMFAIYFCLYAYEQMNITLPAWVKPVYPTALEKLTILQYQLNTFTPKLQQYTGGQLVRKILEDGVGRMEGTMDPEKKIFLYSGHEYNVAHILRTIRNFAPVIPNYGSYVVLELHKINGVWGYKAFYQNYKYDVPELLRIPGCPSFCPIDDFYRILKENIPGPDTTCN